MTYTTVGYGDLTLGPGLRVFGTFAGVAGVLGFGISSAFLIAVMSRLLQAGMFGQGLSGHRIGAKSRAIGAP
ncbi:ion channel [Jhaorihella thermophila]